MPYKSISTLIVGSVATDSIETPYGKEDNILGGSATYASIASSYFSATGIVAVVGYDFERKHINLFRRKGVDIEGLYVDNNEKTFHWSGYYSGDMNVAHTRTTCLNAFANFKPTIPAAYRDAKFVMLGNIHPLLQLDVLRQVPRAKLVLCDTMNYWISSEPKLVEKVFRRVDIICINDGEAMQFCKTDSLPDAAARLLKLGPRRVIIKKGMHGAVMFGRDSFFPIPAFPLKKFKDPTGAGDSFAGGFIGMMARTKGITEQALRRAVAAGTVMASFCVEDFSIRKTGRLKAADINRRMAFLRKAVEIPAFKL